MLKEVRTRNGEEFDYSRLYNRPSQWTELLLQLLFYLFMSFVLLTILTDSHRRYSMRRYIRSCLWSCVAAVVLYCVAPVTEWHSGRVVLNFMSGRMFDYMLLLKCSFALVVSLLYSRLYVLISQRQLVEVENERLKNENLTTRYNMLVGQINPHFFFNSLNSLAMLVREKHDQKALTYIDQLSYTFRYIIQNGQSTLITLGEELKFAEAYSYLFKIRYADKLYFDIEVDSDYLCWRLPALSLQPLIGNAVKHNTITRSNPLHVSIRVEDGCLVVSTRCARNSSPNPRPASVWRTCATAGCSSRAAISKLTTPTVRSPCGCRSNPLLHDESTHYRRRDRRGAEPCRRTAPGRSRRGGSGHA